MTSEELKLFDYVIELAAGDDMSYHNENELRKEILSKFKEVIGVENTED